MPFKDIYNEYNRLNDPGAQNLELQARLARANPYLQSILRSIRGDLASRGLASEGPMYAATSKAAGQFTSDITQNFFEGLDTKRMGLLQLMAELEQFQEQMKAQKNAAKWGAIGQLLGFGASFIPGLGKPSTPGGG